VNDHSNTDSDLSSFEAFLQAHRSLFGNGSFAGWTSAAALNENITALTARVAEGIPLMEEADLSFDHSALLQSANQLRQIMEEHISEQYRDIITILTPPEARANPISTLVERTLRGDGAYLSAISKAHGYPLDMLAFFAIFLVRPIRMQARLAIEPHLDISSWRYGYCHVCGLWPQMAWLDSESGRRSLWCVGCGGHWHFSRMVCPFCLENDQTKLGFITVEGWEGYRLQTCESCRRYLKTRDERQVSTIKASGPEVEYLATSTLDTAAAQEKYVRNFVGFAAFDMKDSETAQNYRNRVSNT